MLWEDRSHLEKLLAALRVKRVRVQVPTVDLSSQRLLGLGLSVARCGPFIQTGEPRPRRPVLVDLFCGEGGAGVGYHAAGFDVVGVDIAPQPRYPFAFVKSDAVGFALRYGHLFDAAHASPPCQTYSRSRVLRGREHPDLIAVTRDAVSAVGLPYIIENVEDARSELSDPVLLCGQAWARRFYRHRLFESSVRLLVPDHDEHDWPQAKLGRAAADREMMQLVGHFPQIAFARRQTEMGWASRDGIAQSIPPVFADYVGRQLLGELIDTHAGRQPLVSAA